ncbi:MAG: PhnD/SsuA/transferrin family substrate-binding protein [Hyphomicrobiaceae bacterium]|nr:MAG: PhnD/SsuA/transferrin family substrate-binding protein [Hyphomicrobiaceae bacterium]
MEVRRSREVFPVSRREALAGLALGAATLGLSGPSKAAKPLLRFGLTPVFLDNDLELLSKLQSYLGRATGHEVALVHRRTYQEITALLIARQLDSAWICGYPFVAQREHLELVAVPLWQGKPLYRSYVIVGKDRSAHRLEDLEGDIHAFSDPDSNSGHLVTRAALAAVGRRPETFFKRMIFTYGHRNVARAVGAGLAKSGSLDGYVWEVVREIEPELTSKTKVIRVSELLGFPPVACPKSLSATPGVQALKKALLTMPGDHEGREVLGLLRLDGFVDAPQEVFDGIAEKIAQVRRLG